MIGHPLPPARHYKGGMRIFVAAVAAAVSLSGVGSPARAAVTQPSGAPCSFGPATGGGDYSVRAGPLLVADEDDPTAVHTGTVTCSLTTTPDHTGTPWFSATGPVGTGVVYLAPVEATYTGTAWQRFLCTRLDVDGQTLYWHEPEDRNADGWWTTSPAARCDADWEHADARAEDPPGGYALSAAFAALAESDGWATADSAICAVPAVRDAAGWECGLPSPALGISIARAADIAILRSPVPTGWSCTDVHTGLAVARGSVLTVPNPAVTCDLLPGTSAVECSWVQVSGVLAPATLGRVTVTGACGTQTLTRTFAPGAGRVAEVWSGDHGRGGRGVPPVRCVANEDEAHGGAVAYLAQCNVV